jgi:hypothetical protein
MSNSKSYRIEIGKNSDMVGKYPLWGKWDMVGKILTWSEKKIGRVHESIISKAMRT